MSLNWTQVHPITTRPIPLPNENLSESFRGIDLELTLPVSLVGPKQTFRSSGDIYLSNNRIVFVSLTARPLPPDAPPSLSPTLDTLGSDSSPSENKPASDAVRLPVFLKTGVEYVSSFLSSPQPSDSSKIDLHISTISIPLVQILDRKFNQSLFGSNTISLSFCPTPDGGLPGSQQGVKSIEVSLEFKQSRTWDVWKSLETCLKSAHADELERRRQRQYGEVLPAYSGRDHI